MKKWGPVVKFVNGYGEDVIHGVQKAMDKSQKTEAYSVLREVRQLLDPGARMSIAAYISSGPSMGDIERAIEAAALEQWVAWHWREENNLIPQPIRVSRVPCGSLSSFVLPLLM